MGAGEQSGGGLTIAVRTDYQRLERLEMDMKIAENILRLRLVQMLINERCKSNEFKIPIHLALGHEAIAVAVDEIMGDEDELLLSHRNVHYNLARAKSLKPILDEYYLDSDGLAGGQLGSMNLANKERGIIYTSSILGNNLCVAAGVALGKKTKQEDGIVIVVTGDGAIEEGAFYESLMFMKTCNLRAIIIVENNGWSLATQIHERRCHIHLDRLASSLDMRALFIEGNDPYKYIQILSDAKLYAIEESSPVIIEVRLSTLGDSRLKTEEFPDGKFINYHAGAAPTVEVKKGPVINDDDSDPVFVLFRYFKKEHLEKMAREALDRINGELQ